MPKPDPRPSDITITLRPKPGVDAAIALRRLLKTMLRTYGLRCVSVQTEEEPIA